MIQKTHKYKGSEIVRMFKNGYDDIEKYDLMYVRGSIIAHVMMIAAHLSLKEAKVLSETRMVLVEKDFTKC